MTGIDIINGAFIIIAAFVWLVFALKFILKIILKRKNKLIKKKEWVFFFIPIILIVIVILTRLNTPHVEYHTTYIHFPENIDKITYLEQYNVKKIFELDSNGKIHEKYKFSEEQSNLYCDLFTSKMHVNGTDDIIITDHSKEYSFLEYLVSDRTLRKTKTGFLEAKKNSFIKLIIRNEDGSEDAYYKPDILFEKWYSDILKHYHLKDLGYIWHAIKAGDSIYLSAKGNIYVMNKEFNLRKIYSSKIRTIDPKLQNGVHNIQIYNNKLYIIERIFYPETIVTGLVGYLVNSLLFENNCYLKIMDLNTRKIIKKYIIPSKIDLMEMKYHVLEENRILIDGRYIIDLEKRQVQIFNEEIYNKNIYDFLVQEKEIQ